MLVSDYILDFLVKKKVNKVFLITGGAITFVVDAFSRNKKIKYIFFSIPSNFLEASILVKFQTNL